MANVAALSVDMSTFKIEFREEKKTFTATLLKKFDMRDYERYTKAFFGAVIAFQEENKDREFSFSFTSGAFSSKTVYYSGSYKDQEATTAEVAAIFERLVELINAQLK